MHIMPIMTTRNKGNKSSSRSLARFCRRKHKESTAHPSCSTCRQVYIMRNLVRNLSKFVSKPRESRVALGTRMNGSTLSTLSFIRLAPCSYYLAQPHRRIRLLAYVGHFVSFSWHSSWFINAFAYLSRRFFTLSSPCGVTLNC